MPRRTALIVPVPEAEPAVSKLRLEHDPAARLGVPAHITILFPFAPSDAVDEPSVADVLTPFRAFRFELASLEHFDDDVTYLAPRPAQPFSDLIDAVAAHWPEYPPYEGTIDTVVPHVTLGYAHLEVSIELPIACVAREVVLIEEDDDGRWRTRRRFTLQGVA
jgi:hypothetical protein